MGQQASVSGLSNSVTGSLDTVERNPSKQASKAKQSKAKQSKAKQSKAKQSKQKNIHSMVIVTGEGYDSAIPPRSIFDPPNVAEDEELSGEEEGEYGGGGLHNSSTWASSSFADTLTTRGDDTLSTGAHYHSAQHKRRQRKHPSQLNEVELRIQLWDSYRLARIILGKPIQSCTLRGKTILHSIRKVAEMKLELIRLGKELEMADVYREQQQQQEEEQQQQQQELAKQKKANKKHKNIKDSKDPSTDGGNKPNLSSQSSVATEKQRKSSGITQQQQQQQETLLLDPADTSTSLIDELEMKMANLRLPQGDMAQQIDEALWQQTSPAIKRKEGEKATSTTPGTTTRGRPDKGIASGTCAASSSHPDTSRDYPDDDDDNDDGDEENDIPTPVRKTKTLSTEQLLDLYKQRYETLQGAHQEMMQEFQTQLLQIQAHAETAEIREEEEDQVAPGVQPHGALENLYSTAPGEPSGAGGAGTEVVRGPTKTIPAAGTTRPKDISNSKNASSTPSKSSPSKRSRADVAMRAASSVARKYDISEQTPEERHLHTEIAKAKRSGKRRTSSQKTSPLTETLTTVAVAAAAETTTTTTQINTSEERKKLTAMIQQLMKRVEESSEETKAQFESLQEQLRAHQGMASVNEVSVLLGATPNVSFDESANQDTSSSSSASRLLEVAMQEDFQRRLRTAKTLHTLELETFKNKHAQQVVDLSGQLDAYQHQVEQQNLELQKWRRKYRHLEEMAVTPEEARQVLEELEALSPNATPAEHEQVQARVIQVLQRMTQLLSRKEKEQESMSKNMQAAVAREAETLAQLEDLLLQHELLEDDTKVSPQEWNKQLSQQRKAFEKELKDIFKREEKRMLEMERLEVQLTDLAFLAVEVEDLEVDFKVNDEVYAEELAKARNQFATNAPIIQNLNNQVKQVLASQRKAILDLERSWSRGSELEHFVKGRLSDFSSSSPSSPTAQEQLERKEAELRKTQAKLLASQQRVRDLETVMGKHRSDWTVSTVQLSD